MTDVEITEILRPGRAAYLKAADLLNRGELVAFPTETVYGLGADATNDEAVAKIFAAKERPSFNPLIVHCLNAEHAGTFAELDARAQEIAAAFWPGPLTLVLPRKPDSSISLLCSAGLNSLALRVPQHPVGQELLKIFGLPIAAPSANRSGKVSPTTAAHVAKSLDGRVALILDGGPCPIGVESTVLDLTERQAKILRPGGVTQEALEKVIGSVEVATASGDVKAPGMLGSHYAPDLKLRLMATEVDADEALLAFGPAPLSGAASTVNLSETGDLEEAAARLFSALRELDYPAFKRIAVMPIPENGLGIAINDRLRRAAATRPLS